MAKKCVCTCDFQNMKFTTVKNCSGVFLWFSYHLVADVAWFSTISESRSKQLSNSDELQLFQTLQNVQGDGGWIDFALHDFTTIALLHPPHHDATNCSYVEHLNWIEFGKVIWQIRVSINESKRHTTLSENLISNWKVSLSSI